MELADLPQTENYFCPMCKSIVPLDLPRVQATDSSPGDATPKGEQKKKILIADDNDRVRNFTAGLLLQAGYGVLEAKDGQEALNIIRSEGPDFILLTVMLPLMTGFDVVVEIKKDARLKNIPVFLMSDVVSDSEVIGVLEHYGVNGFINKREIKDWLLARVQQIISK